MNREFGWETDVSVRDTLIAMLCMANSMVYAVKIHDNDNYNDHIATSNVVNIPGFGNFDAGGIVRIRVEPANQEADPAFLGSGVLLKGSRYVLTAAHLFDDKALTNPGDIDVLSYQVGLRNLNGDIRTKTFSGGDLSGGTIDGLTGHNEFKEWGDLIPSPFFPGYFSSSVFAGYDVALIDLGEDLAAELQQLNFPTHEVYPFNPVGNDMAVVGFGSVGKGSTPNDEQNPFNADRYWATNQLDAYFVGVTFEVLATANEETQLLYDFDDGPGGMDYDGLSAIDASFADSANIPGEGSQAVGDSGGPGLLRIGNRWMVAGIVSYGFSTSKDFDAEFNSSYGEVSVLANLGAPNDPNVPEGETIADWINREASIASRFKNTSGGALNDSSNWTFGQIATASMDANITFNISTFSTVNGPSGAMTFRSLSIGRGLGDKEFLLENGGSLTIVEDFLIDYNSFVEFSNGSVTAGRLIVQGLPPFTPSPLPGTFAWGDMGSATSLNVNKIIVNSGGQFLYNRSVALALANTDYEIHGGYLDTDADAFHLASGRTLDMTGGEIVTAEFRIEASATATITDSTAIALISADLLTLNGTLHMDHGQVQGDDLTIASGGRLEIGLGGTTPGSEFANFILDGDATLAGTLAWSYIDSFVPTLGDEFEFISADTITGAFTSITGAVTSNDLRLAIEYLSTSVLVTAALKGDVNVDGVVNFGDIQPFVDVVTGVSPLNPAADVNGDGLVNFGDIQPFVDLVTGGGSFSTPEPGTALLLAGIAPLLIGRRCAA